jgi:archaellum component FlaF (FlaF/FlaG flagellin family)
MSKRPVLGIDAILSIEDTEINVEHVVISVEQNINGFIWISGDEIEVIVDGEFVDFKDAPDWVI